MNKWPDLASVKKAFRKTNYGSRRARDLSLRDSRQSRERLGKAATDRTDREVVVAVVALNHVQLAMPPGGEGAPRHFYADILNIPDIQKPPILRIGATAGSGAAH